MSNIVKKFLVVTAEFLSRLLFSLPRFAWANWLKSMWLRALGAKVGRRVIFYPGVWIMPGRNLSLGDDVDLALDVLITSGGGVEIGDRVLVGYRTQILSSNHVIPSRTAPIFSAGHVHKPVVIHRDVWIGGGCVILPGVEIGEGAVIGAGSVVSKSVPAYAVAVGNPARVVRARD